MFDQRLKIVASILIICVHVLWKKKNWCNWNKDCILQAYDEGDYYPVWGICLGLQELSALTAGVLVTTDARVWDQSLPLNFSKGECEALEGDSFSLFYW